MLWIHYNLACYWSLANNKRQALKYLARAFDLKDHYRSLVAEESDFDAIRSDPAFQSLVRVTGVGLVAASALQNCKSPRPATWAGRGLPSHHPIGSL